MTLYRATDAADMVPMLIAAYCQRVGMVADTLESYLQASQQHDGAAGPTDAERSHLAGLLGEEAPKAAGERGLSRIRYRRGQHWAENAQELEEDPQKLFTKACLHGLKARLCDDVDALDSYLPPHVAEMARKVAGVLEMPQTAPA
ncbi:hypothetical protein ABZX62_34300 [Streptomyces flavidovirens]|uniref:hypothetical protein n=1 Tax=Streptomyces flavidovirens TaxID=67298 RepID=UPI0033AD47C4